MERLDVRLALALAVLGAVSLSPGSAPRALAAGQCYEHGCGSQPPAWLAPEKWKDPDLNPDADDEQDLRSGSRPTGDRGDSDRSPAGGPGGSRPGGSSRGSGASPFDHMEQTVRQAKDDWRQAYADYESAKSRGDPAAMQAAERRMKEAHERAERARNEYTAQTGLEPPAWLLASGTGRREDHPGPGGGGGGGGHGGTWTDTGGAGKNYQPPEAYAAIGYGTLVGFNPLMVDGQPLIGTDGKPIMAAQFAADQNAGAGGTISAVPTDKMTPDQLRRFRDAGFAVQDGMVLVSMHFYAAAGAGGPQAGVGWQPASGRDLHMTTPVGAVSPEVVDTLTRTVTGPDGWAWSYDAVSGTLRTPGGIVHLSLAGSRSGGSGGDGSGVVITPPETVPVGIASVELNPNPVAEGQTVTLTVRTTGPVARGIVSFAWGQTVELAGAGNHWSAATPAPPAARETRYPVTVTVAGDSGQTATHRTAVTVRPAPPDVVRVSVTPNPVRFADTLTVIVEVDGRATDLAARVLYRRPDYPDRGGQAAIPLSKVSGEAPGRTVWRGSKTVDWITPDEWQDVMAGRALPPYAIAVTATGPTGQDSGTAQVVVQGTTVWVVPVPD